GGGAAMANLVNLSGNFLIASVIEALGKAFALIGKAGIDRAQYLDILTNTLFGAPVYKTYGKLIAEEHYTPAGFKAELGYKDVGLNLERSPGAESAHAACELHLRPFPRAPCLARRRSRLLGAGASCQTRCRRGAAASVRMSRDAMAVRAANKSNAPPPPHDCPPFPRS